MPSTIEIVEIVGAPVQVQWLDPRALEGDPANERGEISVETDAELQGLADSIRENGILEPLQVFGRGGHTIIRSGHRRRAAALLLGLDSVPCIVVDPPGAVDQAVQRLVANIQRKEINPVALAVTCKRLREAHPELTQTSLAAKLGMSQPQLANLMRLLRLPDKVLDYIADGRLSAGHGMALLRVEEAPITYDGKEAATVAEFQANTAARWVGQNSSVRAAEAEIESHQSNQKWYRQRQETNREYEKRRAEQEAAQAGIPVEELEAKRVEEKRAEKAEGRARTKRVRAVQEALVEAVRVYDSFDYLPLVGTEHVRMMALALNKGYLMADVRKAWGLPTHDEMIALILACENEDELITYCARLAMPQVLEVYYDGKSISTASSLYSNRAEILRRAEEAWGVQTAAKEAVEALEGSTLAAQAGKGTL